MARGERGERESDVCAGCSLHPLEVSLVLVCNHRLCLQCARDQLAAKATPSASCPDCGSVTQVDAGAAEQIQDYSASPKSPGTDRRTPVQSEPIASPPRAHDHAGIVLPRPKSPVNAQSPLPNSDFALQICGQCQGKPADVECLQCEEMFCHACYKKMHSAGRMREHRFTALAAGPARAAPSANVTEFCTQHGEMLRFYCLDCQECTCAECAVQRSGLHHGHDVVNVRNAYQQLAQPMREALETAAARLRKSPKSEQMRACEQVMSKGRQDLKKAFLNLQNILKSKEELLLKGAEESGQMADQALLAKAKQCEATEAQISRLREWLDVLGTNDISDEIVKLNLYAFIKRGFEALLPQAVRGLAL